MVSLQEIADPDFKAQNMNFLLSRLVIISAIKKSIFQKHTNAMCGMLISSYNRGLHLPYFKSDTACFKSVTAIFQQFRGRSCHTKTDQPKCFFFNFNYLILNIKY